MHDRSCGCAEAPGEIVEPPALGELHEAIRAGQEETGYPGVANVVASGVSCTGTLISPREILTSKRCAKPGLRAYFEDEWPLETLVDAQLTHPTKDLMILHLPEANYNSAPLPINRAALPSAGTVCTSIGYGPQDEPGSARRSCTVTVESSSSTTITARMLTGIPDQVDASGPPQGDTGGPLICDGKVAAVDRDHTDGNWPSHIRENYATIDVDWITGAYAFEQFIHHSGSWFDQAEDTRGDFSMTAFDGDNRPDLVFIKRRNTGTGKIEVHVRSGASGYQTKLVASDSGLLQSEDAFGSFLLAKIDADATPDLVFIKRRSTGSGKIEVRAYSGASSYQAVIQDVPSAVLQSDDANGDFMMANVDADAKPDLVFIKRRNTGTGKIEVHSYSGASNYQTAIQHAPSNFSVADGENGDFALDDYDGDGKPDLIFFKRRNSNSLGLEVWVRSGASNYAVLLKSSGTGLALADKVNGDFVLQKFDADTRPDLVFIKRRNVASNKIEVHILRG